MSGAPAEDIAWLGLIVAAAATAAALAWLAPVIADELLVPEAPTAFPEWRPLILPEPAEEARFLLAIAIPLALAASVLALSSGRPPERRLDPWVVATQVAGLGFAIWALTEQTRDSWTLPGFHEPLIFSVPNLVAGLIIGGALTAVIALRPSPDWPRMMALARWLREHSVIAPALAVIVTALWLLPAIVTENTVGDSGLITPSHIAVQFEDYQAVVNGRTPLVDYVAQYASLLPLVASPVLSAFDSSLGAFSLIECALTFGALIAAYAAIREVVQGRWVALGLYLPVLAITLFPWTIRGEARDFSANYYAQLPNRYLGPLVTFWLFARALRRGSPPLWVVFLAAGLTVFNNIEFGLTCLAALVVAASVSGDPSQPVRARLGGLAVQAAAGLVAATALVAAVTLIRTGELPDLGILTYWSRLFGRSAFGLLPMPLFGLHWAVFFTYVAATLVAAVRVANRAEDRTLTGALSFVGVYGLVTGQYYAARSDPINLILLFFVWGLAVALLAWTVHLAAGRGNEQPGRRWWVGAFAAMAALGVMISTVNRFPAPWEQADRLAAEGEPHYELSEETEYVKSRTAPGEAVLVIGTPVDHRVAERADVVNVSPWGYGAGALISPREVNRAWDNLREEGGDKLFETGTIPSVRLLLPQLGFRLIDSDPETGIREWRLQ